MGKHDYQLTTTQRGLGAAHQRLREHLLRQLRRAGSLPCPRCPQLMYPWQELDLDHDQLPRALGGRPGEGRLAHRSCNRSAGAQLGNVIRSLARPQRPKRPKRRVTAARRRHL